MLHLRICLQYEITIIFGKSAKKYFEFVCTMRQQLEKEEKYFGAEKYQSFVLFGHPFPKDCILFHFEFVCNIAVAYRRVFVRACMCICIDVLRRN